MILLQIDNSESQIIGLNIEQMKKVRALTSYTADPKSSFYTGFKHVRYNLMDKRGRFPTGLLYLVQDYLDQNQMIYSINDIRVEPNALKSFLKLSLPFSPYPEQIAAVEACRRFKRGIVSAPTGIGKSTIITLLIEGIKVPSLVVVPSIELKDQLTKFIKDVFGPTDLIFVRNIDSTDLSEVSKKVQMVIIDEFHHSAAKTYRALNKNAWKHIFYKFGLTATPFRSQDTEKLLLESVLSKVIYQIDYKTSVKKGYIVPMEAYFIESPKQKYTGPNSWPSVYSNLVVNNSQRNEKISSAVKNLLQHKKFTLVLVKEIKHGMNLLKTTFAFFANGEDKDTSNYIELFNKGKTTSLIGTNGVLGEGVDTKPAEYIIITGLGKSKNAFMQQCGRGFRVYPGKKSCKIIIFKDESHKWTKEHFKAQCKILKEEYGVIPVKLGL